jgi:hypothetical protein
LKPFAERFQYLKDLLSDNKSEYIKLVDCETINCEAETKALHDKYVLQGYEGLMVRNIESPYLLLHRSNDLLKYKEFEDGEFIISGANPSEDGKELGCIIWILSLVGNPNETFTCRPRDTHQSRRADWLLYCTKPENYIGSKYTVRFQGKYDNGKPRFPVGIAIRYDLD